MGTLPFPTICPLRDEGYFEREDFVEAECDLPARTRSTLLPGTPRTSPPPVSHNSAIEFRDGILNPDDFLQQTSWWWRARGVLGFRISRSTRREGAEPVLEHVLAVSVSDDVHAEVVTRCGPCLTPASLLPTSRC